jgi:NADH-quinone oxidoreductase subunit L
MTTSLALIPLLPLAGFLINGILGARLPKGMVSLVACGLPAASFALTVLLFLDLLASQTPVVATHFTWAAMPGLKLDAALYFDQVTAVMCLVVTGIGTLIHVYSIGYMHERQGLRALLRLPEPVPVLHAAAGAGGQDLRHAVHRLGRRGPGVLPADRLLVRRRRQDRGRPEGVHRQPRGRCRLPAGAFLMLAYAGTLDFQDLNAFFSATPPAAWVTTAIGLLLLVGACGKSAQIPLHVWLPDAMAGPTPVSALIHAATMVTAGVYLIARLSGVYLQTEDAMTIVAWLGAITALVGASMGVTEFNLKKVLAYSTMSQIGLMIMACGLGAFSVGMFHLTTHAFFKACLFLGAGAVLHALHGEEDMRKMGALARRMPFTFGVFLLATLALCGIPPFAGFFSKDEILWTAWSAAGGSPLLWLVASAASFLTAFYMFRAIFMTFFGADNVSAERRHGIHEPPPTMSIVLGVLAVGSLLAGLIGLPLFWRELLGVTAPFYDFLEPVLGHATPRADVAHSTEAVLMVVAVLVAALGIALAWFVYGRARDRAVPAVAPAPAPGLLRRWVSHGYYVDAFYEGVIVRFVAWLSVAVFARKVESALAAGTIGSPARAAPVAARLFARLQTGDLQTYVFYALVGLVVILGWGALHA